MRYQAVRLYGSGYSAKEVMNITGCSRTSLMEWCRAYRRYGVAGLVDQRSGGNSAKLSASELERLQNQWHQYKPSQLFAKCEYTGNGEFWQVPDLAQLLAREDDVRYKSKNSYRNGLKRCGLRGQRPVQQDQSRSETKVMAFEEELEKNWSTSPKRRQRQSLWRAMKPHSISRRPSRWSGHRWAKRRWSKSTQDESTSISREP
jgi:transposase